MKTKRRSAPLAALGLALVLTACGPAHGPTPGSIEDRLSWGLKAVNAEPAFKRGVTGQGITVALIDCGVDGAQRDLAGRLSPRSIDLNPDRPLGTPDAHASQVAGPLGSARDGKGVTGVAYNATLLSIRADFDGGIDGKCAYYPADLARALDYAVTQKARIAVLALRASLPLGESFEDALARAAAAGLAIVVAAGNEGDVVPAWPARYAVDPRFAGSIIVAGATRPDGSLATWSNRAGEVQSLYVTAPGEGVITDCSGDRCKRVSGTSVAAPYVAGALALVMEADPRLSAAQAIARVLAAAQPLGDPEKTGRGSLDVGRIFASSLETD